jgi:cell division protein ZapA (FtsZ GTPase activity inhibitor)
MDQKITIKIADYSFSLVAKSPEQEEIIRKAAAHTDKQITSYQAKYPYTSIAKLFAMIALNMAVENVSFSKRLQEVLKNEESLAKELQGYLDNIDKNSR